MNWWSHTMRSIDVCIRICMSLFIIIRILRACDSLSLSIFLRHFIVFDRFRQNTHTDTGTHTKKKHRCCSKSRKKKNKTNSIAHISSVLSAQLNQSNSETWSTFQRQFLSSLSNVRPQTNQINCWPNCVAGCSRVQSNYRAAYTKGMFAFLR